ncbi:MAG TPA: hypothetical protein VMH77_09270 [Steroidobacteraceae bacterium]|nr:hypothetical protein [Steroidobacteraceae bacterium]
MNAGRSPVPTPFAADGGLPPRQIDPGRDAFQALFDLMVVVEALCPVWPERPAFTGSERFLL